jgi:hypothetical protein
MRLVCYCRDCRAYARHLGDEGALDEAGGTELFQTSVACIALDAGLARIACLRMTPRGPLRWYAGCCDSALANTAPVCAIPFGGVIVARLSGDRDALGPVGARVHTGSAEASGKRRPRAHGLGQVLYRFIRTTLAARAAGAHRRHPFFPDGKPLAAPHTLTAEERRAAYR